MTYREPADVAPPLVRPPPILGFGFYVLGTGCAALGLAQLAAFAEKIHAVALAPVPSLAFLIGQAMVLVGLVVVWRATSGYQRRLVGVAATLWLTLFVVEMQRGRVADDLVAHASRASLGSTAASLVGRAIVLLVVALVVYASGRAFASRTWATTLGATLVFSDAWAGAWPIVTRSSSGVAALRLQHATPSTVAAGIGLLLAAGGLFAAGSAILRGVTIGEYVRAHTTGVREQREQGITEADLARGLPLFTDGVTAVAGLALAHAAAVAVATRLGLSMRDVGDTTTLGGELVAWTIVFVAIRRMRLPTTHARGFASAVLVALVLEAVLRYVAWSRGLFFGGSGATFPPEVVELVAGIRVLLAIRALHEVTRALGRAPVLLETRNALRRQVRLAANVLGGSLVASFFAPAMASSGLLLYVEALALLLGGLALYLAIGATHGARRIEIALNR